MSQLHGRFTDKQVKALFQEYCQGQLARTDLQELPGIGKSRFFARLKACREDPGGFTIAYQQSAPAKLSPEAEDALQAALLGEKAIVEDPDLPISSYDYTAVRDRLQVTHKTINTIENGKYVPSTYLALKIAGAFGVTVEELFQLDDEGVADGA